MPESAAPTYLIVTGASVARRTPEVLRALAPVAGRVLTLLTPGARRVISPRELALVPGHQIVESYFDAAILPRPAPGVVVIAPCTFNTLNKLAAGITDNLALSIPAQAIGRRTPLIVAIAVNTPLWTHPRTQESAATLRKWGCTVLDPVTADGTLAMASPETIAAAVRRAWSRLARESA